MSMRVGDNWVDGEAGAFFMIPVGVTHDFANRSGVRAGVLNEFISGGFEREVPAIV